MSISDVKPVVTKEVVMPRNASRVVGVDHISIRVSNYDKSRAFYSKLFAFLGFEVSDDYGTTIGWTNGSTRLWIAEAEIKSRHRIGVVGFHHYAFELKSRKDVDALQAFLEKEKVKIVDPADEYYDDYYAVFFLDPDGLKLEGMKYGEAAAKKKRRGRKK
jgi:catechol 2,3-dioxygenase-like lactoylglutathione lyase family enzyme